MALSTINEYKRLIKELEQCLKDNPQGTGYDYENSGYDDSFIFDFYNKSLEDWCRSFANSDQELLEIYYRRLEKETGEETQK